jgi:phosphatidylinositol-3-phosphatase
MRRLMCLLGTLCVSIAGVFTFATPPAGAVANNGKVMVIMLENHSLSQMQSQMPYLNNLSQLYTYFDNYTAVTHPSEPNYIAIAAGSTLGDTQDHNPAWQTSGQSVFGQAFTAVNGSWQGNAKLYAEDMTSNCQQSNSSLQVGGAAAYAVKHNPWASFTDERNQCKLADVPMGTVSGGNLRTDVDNGTLPNVGMMVPNECNDAHQPQSAGCGLPQADAWLQYWMPVLMNGPDFKSGSLAIVVTADEDENCSGCTNRVLTTVINNHTAGAGVNHTALNHYSLSGFYSDATGSPHLRNAATAPDMRSALGFPAPK